MMDFTSFAAFRAIDPATAKFDRIAYLLGREFTTTNAHKLWEEGYDYGDYPDRLEWAEDGDDTIVVRVILDDGTMELHAHTCTFDPGQPNTIMSWTENYSINTELSDGYET